MSSDSTWTEVNECIARPRLNLTDRAGCFATRAVGQDGRSVNEVARELGCHSQIVTGAVLAYGSALIDHPDRFDDVKSLGLDETAFVRLAPFCRPTSLPLVDDVGDRAFDLLQENGFGSITTRQVAKKAEMDHSIIHKQFGSMVDLSIAVTCGLVDQTLEQLTGGPTPFIGLRARDVPGLSARLVAWMLANGTDPERLQLAEYPGARFARREFEGLGPYRARFRHHGGAHHRRLNRHRVGRRAR